MEAYGYVGIFAASLVGSLLVFMPMPFFFIVYFGAVYLDPVLVAIVSSIGATIGKLIIFRAARFGRKFVNEKTRKRFRPFERLSSKYGWVAAFVAALTPLPDDIVYVPLGFVGYSQWKFMGATFVGKLLFTLAITWGARFSFPWVSLIIGEASSFWHAVAITIVGLSIFIVIIYAIIRCDWSKWFEKWFPWTLEGYDASNKKEDKR